MKYFINIYTWDDDLVEEKGPYSEREAEKIDSGMNINLDHSRFYTLIVEKPERVEA